MIFLHLATIIFFGGLCFCSDIQDEDFFPSKQLKKEDHFLEGFNHGKRHKREGKLISKLKDSAKIRYLVVSDPTAAEALIYSGWRTRAETAAMDDNGKISTLIVELEKISSHSIQSLQQFPTVGNTQSLVGFAYITTFLKSKRIRTVAERESASYEDQRSALIDAVSKRGFFEVSYLQSLGDVDLYNKGVQAFGNDLNKHY